MALPAWAAPVSRLFLVVVLVCVVHRCFPYVFFVVILMFVLFYFSALLLMPSTDAASVNSLLRCVDMHGAIVVNLFYSLVWFCLEWLGLSWSVRGSWVHRWGFVEGDSEGVPSSRH